MRLGARILKTGVAIVLALFIAELLKLPTTVFAGIAAIFAIQPSIYRSYLRIVEQIQGNIIGAIIAVTFVLIFGHQLIIIGLAAVVIILLMNKLGLEKSISMALVMMIAIMEIKGDEFLSFALLRFFTIVVGVLSAFLVNLLFMPPKYETKLFQSIHETQDEIIRWTRLAGRQASEHIATKKSIKKLKDRLTEIDQTYLFFKEERSYFKKITRTKTRKLVIYRQMIATSRSSYEVLKKLHQYENELINLPEHFRIMVQERLDILLTFHEQLHLKFVGKLKAENLESNLENYIQRHEVMEIFAKEISVTKEIEDFSTYHLLHILSAILNYEEQLEHLDKLITYIQKNHESEVSKEIQEDIY
ncbi:aromatic acid exporter family protein [Sporosarcina pasteurii]|uniref:Predicted membrane protein n=1 Tax=Sporosarcina pasteurii TaxID=1474 RepID=A0A380CCJ5_SPOPA|nr:aromatic acid exporter family protein [Sporosarcina pasteurii]MDS9473323.1 aromatic acid exporter family protein [Sporosarcina pasteurii]QBQ04294.1 aromatic acid exporter family protein [Sporosarcina pasteurii]SUJ16630.1 Predicted membrane protein [Sporosarcina pasteurii]